MTQEFLQNLIPWLFSHGLKIVLILAAAFLTNWILKAFINKGVMKAVDGRLGRAQEKRAKTLISIFRGTLKFIIGIVALLMILPEFGLSVAPLLAGAGLVGLAIGMGSKEIISDFLAGLFIILEDQYHVGDRVKIAGVEGEVKEISLRRTVVKEESGLFHSIPNGQIKTIAKKFQ